MLSDPNVSLHMDVSSLPEALPEAMLYFADPRRCLAYIASRRWPAGAVRCPVCGTRNVRFLENRQLWECRSRHPGAQFSVRVGTIFEDSHVSLCQWLIAIWIIANSARRVSSYELAGRLGITQKSAWFVQRRIRCALELRGWKLPALGKLPDPERYLAVPENSAGARP